MQMCNVSWLRSLAALFGRGLQRSLIIVIEICVKIYSLSG